MNIPNCVECEPSDVMRIFDVRSFDHAHEPWHTPWGHTAYASERAEIALGGYTAEGRTTTVPVSGSGYGDTRENESEWFEARRRAIFAFNEQLAQWENGTEPDGVHGGAVCYKPVAVAIANFGWAVISDGSAHRMINYGGSR